MANKSFKPQPLTPEPEPQNMLEAEYQPHYDAWKTAPGPKTMGNLLNTLNPVINSALRTYGGADSSPTLRSRAKILAAEGINRYDPLRAKLRTHLMSHLQGLRRMNIQENQVIGIPERVGIDLYHLHKSEHELRDKLNREPSTMELADHTGISTKRIAHVRQAQPGMAEGALRGEGDAGEEQVALGPAVEDTGVEKMWRDMVYHDLGPVDQLLMEHTLGMHGRSILSKQQIARKLGVSPGAISQRASRIQALLDKRENVGGAFFGGR